jgi:uncharacterized protein
MKNQHMMIITIVSIAIAIVAVISAADIDLPNVPNPSGQTVSVNGIYTAIAEPTEATIVIGFENEANTAAAAQKENADEMANVLVALRNAGLSDDDFKTLNYNLWDRRSCPNVYGMDESNCEKTYHASHTLEVTTDKLDLVGVYLDTAIEGGANNIHNVRFSVSEEKQNELKAEALEKATKDARTKADALARGMGLEVYRVVSISDSSWDLGIHKVAYAEIEEASAVAGGVHADTQILSDDVEVTARVYAEFELA